MWTRRWLETAGGTVVVAMMVTMVVLMVVMRGRKGWWRERERGMA
jgi:hypothetical protein